MTEHSSLAPPGATASLSSAAVAERSRNDLIYILGFAATFVFGLGWQFFPFDIRMVWTMFAQAVLLSLVAGAIVVAVVQFSRYRTLRISPALVALVLLWLIIGAYDLLQACDHLRIAVPT